MAEYYAQRAVVPGTLLITEAVFISARARGRDINAPGVFTDEQIRQWTEVTKAVHERGSFIYCQIWAIGRAARPHVLKAQGLEMVSSSAVPISEGHATPRAMEEDEILQCIDDFASAAENAVKAGFDGVEIHGANGYLVDQFTQDTCNQRTDRWGGTVENRSRFAFEVTQTVSKRIGSERTAIRLAPFTDFQGMGMKDPVPQFSDLISKLATLKLAYLHLVEPRISGNIDRDTAQHESLDFATDAWSGAGPLILAGGFDASSARSKVRESKHDVAIAFGRQFTSNPDLPRRIIEGLPLTNYDRSTFYVAKSEDGYTTWPSLPTESVTA
ncbi:Chanoclavine-I aldehyde [Cyphellophora attinorum]|uniref:Chanoclavine-I aldehyde n=1 Tax=Cyphellophora attinorum TaxID=1664694 RepID=A0A0N0NM93_9EURO|nr:Chanoclavine-I aldehyde [Phialophora attinorum]KPI40191.1 Chanoclavine-I aldehyde [Phialophora attinorum]